MKDLGDQIPNHISYNSYGEICFLAYRTFLYVHKLDKFI